MNIFFKRTAVLAGVVSVFVMLAWGQGEKPKPNIGPKSGTASAASATAYLLNEIRKLKLESSELKTRLASAEARLASVEAKNASQDDKIDKKEDKMPIGPNYAGGGWCSKQVFLTALDPNTTMIRYIQVK